MPRIIAPIFASMSLAVSLSAPGMAAAGGAAGIADPAIDRVDAPVATSGTAGASSTADGDSDPACPAEPPEHGAECDVPGLSGCDYPNYSCLCETPATPDVIPKWYCWETETTETDTSDSAAAGGASSA